MEGEGWVSSPLPPPGAWQWAASHAQYMGDLPQPLCNGGCGADLGRFLRNRLRGLAEVA